MKRLLIAVGMATALAASTAETQPNYLSHEWESGFTFGRAYQYGLVQGIAGRPNTCKGLVIGTGICTDPWLKPDGASDKIVGELRRLCIRTCEEGYLHGQEARGEVK